METRYFKSDDYAFRALQEEDGRKFIEGYASVFNVRSKLILDKDQLFYEEIVPGAFTEVLNREGLDVIFTFNHSKDVVLARTISGTLSLSQDERGLFFRAQIDPNVSAANDLWFQINRRDISENSFRFRVTRDDYSWLPPDENGIPTRMIKNVRDLIDVSAVTYASYPETEVEARELQEIIDSKEKEEISDPNIEVEKIRTKIRIIQIENKI